MKRGYFEGSARLLRLIIRRERVTSAVWILGIVLFTVGMAPALSEMFATGSAESLASLALLLENPAMTALMGPIIGGGQGAMFVNFMFLWILIAAGVMNIFLIARHTRADEEYGRLEVIRSLPVGRLADVNSAMLSALIVNGMIALLTGFGLAVMNVDGFGFGGSMLFGVALGAGGLYFAAVAALFCQLSSSSRGALALSGVMIGVIYMLRAAGDMDSQMEFLSWLSPMGLLQRSEIYHNDYWWPSLVVLAQTVIIAAIAYRLNAARDMGQGLLPARPGRGSARKSLLSPYGLSWRLTRNPVIAWFATMFIVGASYGTIMGSEEFETFIADNEFYAQLMGAGQGLPFSMPQLFVSLIGVIMAFIGTVGVLMIALKPRSEERELHCEHVLSRSVSRGKYITSFTVFAYAAGILIQLGTAFGVYATAAPAMAHLPNPDVDIRFLLEANLVYLPAMWVMTGLTVLIVGLAPKATGVLWGYYAVSFFVIFLGRMPDLIPEWVTKITPFAYIPTLPMDEITAAPLIILTAIAAVLTALGIVFYKRRDMAS